MKLKQVYSAVIHPNAPYNFDYSTHNPSHYPTPLVKREEGKLWFSFRFKNKLLGIKFTNEGSVDKPKIKLEVYYLEPLHSDFMEDLLKELGHRFRFGSDNSEFYKNSEHRLKKVQRHAQLLRRRII